MTGFRGQALLLLCILCAGLLSLPIPANPDSQKEQEKYELHGKIVKEDGQPISKSFPVIVLRGSTMPFVARTQAGPGGAFKFKGLLKGIYTIVAHIPRAGYIEKTIEVGPSFADSRRRVRVELAYFPGAAISEHLVSANELSVPQKAWNEYEKAQISQSRWEVDAAVDHLKRAVKIAPQFTDAWNNLGTIAYHSRRYAEAEHYFREALKQESDAYSPLVNLGGALLSQGKIEESLEINLQAVRARPDDTLGQAQLGQSYYYLGRFDEAAKHLSQAKQLDPSHFSYPQLVLAEIYRRQGRHPAFISELEEFLEFHPDSKEAPEIRNLLQKARALQPAP